MDTSLLLTERIGAVAILTLNRPEKRNAVNSALAEVLFDAMKECDADEAVKVIVVTGAGNHAFCAGGDMGEILERSVAGRERPSLGVATALGALAKPTIAAVNGFAYGLGAQLAVAADMRIASTNAKFRFVAAAYGLINSCVELPLIVGAPKAKELLFSTRVVEGAEAGRIGLANHVVAPEELMPRTLQLAEQIAASSAPAVRWAKRVVDTATVLEAAALAEEEARRELVGSRENTTRFSAAARRVTGRG